MQEMAKRKSIEPLRFSEGTHAREEEKMNNKAEFSGKTRIILVLLSVCGTVLCAWNLIRTFQGHMTLLGVLSNVIQFLAYLSMLIFVAFTYKIKGSAPFQGVVIAFAALLGIQLLQSGQAIAGFGLNETLTLMINIFNLIAFAGAIVFSCKLDERKKAVGYLTIAVILKLIGELTLIIKLWSNINFGIVLISLSVPVLGIIILLAYLNDHHQEI